MCLVLTSSIKEKASVDWKVHSVPVVEGLVFMCMSVYACVSLCAACACRYLQWPEGGTESLKTEATGSVSPLS